MFVQSEVSKYNECFSVSATKCQYIKKWIDFLCYKWIHRLGERLLPFQLHSSLINCCTVPFQFNGKENYKLCTILMFQKEKGRRIKKNRKDLDDISFTLQIMKNSLCTCILLKSSLEYSSQCTYLRDRFARLDFWPSVDITCYLRHLAESQDCLLLLSSKKWQSNT